MEHTIIQNKVGALDYEDIKFSSLRSVLEAFLITPEEFMEFANKKSKENFAKVLKEEKRILKKTL